MKIGLNIAENKRKHIKATFIDEFNVNDLNSIEVLSEDKIKFLIKSYDHFFLNDYIKKNLSDPIKVSLSNRMTRSGGKTIYINKNRIKSFEIRLSSKVMGTFVLDNKSKMICGIEAVDLLEAIMLILEHELCHVLEFSIYGDSNCKRSRFKLMAKSLYNHTSSYHEIFKEDYDKKEELSFNIGQSVIFHYKEEKYEGIISNINKRATVMVKSLHGNYKDNQGIKYAKWYVPFSRLKFKE